MTISINDMDKNFLNSLNPENVHWEHGTFPNLKCDVDDGGCSFTVKHACMSDDSADAEVIKSLCEMHYKPDTQKKWLKRFKNNLEVSSPQKGNNLK